MLQLKDPTCHNEDKRPHVLQLRPGTAKQINEYFLKESDYLPTSLTQSLKKGEGDNIGEYFQELGGRDILLKENLKHINDKEQN